MTKEYTEHTSDIVVIGSGLGGMASALALSKANNNVILISLKKTNYQFINKENRTIALTPVSLKFLYEILDEEGVDLLNELINPIADIYVLDNKQSDKMLHFADTKDYLGYIITNQGFRELLWQQVKKCKNINLLEDKEISYIELASHDFDYSTLYLNDNQKITGKLIALCNGFKSSIYQKYFSPLLIKDYKQIALTFNIQHKKNHEFCAIEHFLPTGPFAILPLKEQTMSSIIWTVPPKLAKYLTNISQSEFEYYVQKNFGDFLGKISLASHINTYPLIAYLSKKYFYKNLVLVADTAHIIHPLSGQGFNQGLKDISLLTDLYNNHLNTSNILTEYQKQRELDNFTMFFATDSLNTLFSNHNTFLSTIRSNGLSIVNKIPALKNYFQRYASGIR